MQKTLVLAGDDAKVMLVVLCSTYHGCVSVVRMSLHLYAVILISCWKYSTTLMAIPRYRQENIIAGKITAGDRMTAIERWKTEHCRKKGWK